MTEHIGVLDPRRRVNYRLGLVLGETEFRQEQDHHRERVHQHHRGLHGYGTVAGLAVRWQDEREIAVDPGVAIDQAGRTICVPRTQCAVLDDWLGDNVDEVREASTAGTVTLAVEVSWRECPTDPVPLPTEQCRSEFDSAVPSRIVEAFDLRLRPMRDDELAPADGTGDEPMEPVSAEGTATEDAIAWTTARHDPEAGDPCIVGPVDGWVLLARVVVPLTDADPPRADGAPTIETERRPFLLPTARLQELLLGLLDRSLRLDELEDVEAADPGTGQVLAFDGERWAPVDPTEPSMAGPASGDLDGRYPDPSVVALRSHPLIDQDPTPGDALVDDGAGWRPQQIVTAGAGGAALVAAGTVDLRGRTEGPVLGGLKVVEHDRDRLDLSLDDYRAPGEEHSYVVSVGVRLPSRGSAPIPTIASRLLGDVIRLELDFGDRQVDDEQHSRIALMVQVLRIGRAQP